MDNKVEKMEESDDVREVCVVIEVENDGPLPDSEERRVRVVNEIDEAWEVIQEFAFRTHTSYVTRRTTRNFGKFNLWGMCLKFCDKRKFIHFCELPRYYREGRTCFSIALYHRSVNKQSYMHCYYMLQCGYSVHLLMFLIQEI